MLRSPEGVNTFFLIYYRLTLFSKNPRKIVQLLNSTGRQFPTDVRIARLYAFTHTLTQLSYFHDFDPEFATLLVNHQYLNRNTELLHLFA